MPKSKYNFQVGQWVHVDVDDAQWGRVASDAKIVEVRRNNLLVNVTSLRANISIPKSEAKGIADGVMCPKHPVHKLTPDGKCPRCLLNLVFDA